MSDPIRQYPWEQFKRFSLLLGLLFLGFLLLGFVYQSIFLSICISLILTYVLGPLVDRIERVSKARRALVVSAVLIGFFGTILLLGSLFIPQVYRDLSSIIGKVPRAISYLNNTMDPVKTWLADKGYLSTQDFERMVGGIDLAKEVAVTTSNALAQVWTTTPLVLGGVFNMALTPLLSWFFLMHIHSMSAFVGSLIPQDLRAMAHLNILRIHKILWGVIKGQLLVALMLTVLYIAGFSVIGLQSGAAIGAIAGICRIVPYLDVVVGGLLSLLVILGQGEGWGAVVAVIAVISIVQALDGAFITPRIIGDRAGIHPIIVIASVVSFGDWFGILGIIVAVPVVAILSASFQMALPYYRNSPYYRGRTRPESAGP